MKQSIFVDTSAWYAFIDRKDPEHAKVAPVILRHDGQLITSDYIIDETITLLRYRLNWKIASHFAHLAYDNKLSKVYHCQKADLQKALALFDAYHDQKLSFTDCTSFALMKRLKLQSVIALDSDFKSIGFVSMV